MSQALFINAKLVLYRMSSRGMDWLQSSIDSNVECLKFQPTQQVYLKTIALKKTRELISLDRRRGKEERDKEIEVGKSVESMIAAY
ncbi:hypothetical protein COBT_002615, partial [Conglomerata obtusa]